MASKCEAFVRLRPCAEQRLYDMGDFTKSSVSSTLSSRVTGVSEIKGNNGSRTRKKFQDWLRADNGKADEQSTSYGGILEAPGDNGEVGIGRLNKNSVVNGILSFVSPPQSQSQPLRVPQHVARTVELVNEILPGRVFSMSHRQADVFVHTLKPHISGAVLSGGSVVFVATGGCNSDRTFSLYGAHPDYAKRQTRLGLLSNASLSESCLLPCEHPVSAESFVPRAECNESRNQAHIAFSTSLQSFSGTMSPRSASKQSELSIISVPGVLGEISHFGKASKAYSKTSFHSTSVMQGQENMSIGLIHLATDALLRGSSHSTSGAASASLTGIASQATQSRANAASVTMTAMAVYGESYYDLLDPPARVGEGLESLSLPQIILDDPKKRGDTISKLIYEKLLGVQISSPSQVSNLLITMFSNLQLIRENHGANAVLREKAYESIEKDSLPRDVPHLVVELRVSPVANSDSQGRLVFVDLAPLDSVHEHSFTASSAAALADASSLVEQISSAQPEEDIQTSVSFLYHRLNSSPLTVALANAFNPFKPSKIVTLAHVIASFPVNPADSIGGYSESGGASGTVPIAITHGIITTLSHLLRSTGALASYDLQERSAAAPTVLTQVPSQLLSAFRTALGGQNIQLKSISELASAFVNAVQSTLFPNAYSPKPHPPHKSPSSASLRGAFSPSRHSTAGTSFSPHITSLATMLGYTLEDMYPSAVSVSGHVNRFKSSQETFDSKARELCKSSFVDLGLKCWSYRNVFELIKQGNYSASSVAMQTLSAVIVSSLEAVFAELDFSNFNSGKLQDNQFLQKQDFQKKVATIAQQHILRIFSLSSTLLCQNLGFSNFKAVIGVTSENTDSSMMSVKFSPLPVLNWLRDGSAGALSSSLQLNGLIGMPWFSPSVASVRESFKTQLRVIDSMIKKASEIRKTSSQLSDDDFVPFLLSLRALHSVSIAPQITGSTQCTPLQTPRLASRFEPNLPPTVREDPDSLKMEETKSHVRAKSASNENVRKLITYPNESDDIKNNAKAGNSIDDSDKYHYMPTALTIPNDLESCGSELLSPESLEVDLQAIMEQLESAKMEAETSQERSTLLENANRALQLEVTSLRNTLNRHLGLFGPSSSSSSPVDSAAQGGRPISAKPSRRTSMLDVESDAVDAHHSAHAQGVQPTTTVQSSQRFIQMIESMKLRETQAKKEIRELKESLAELGHQRRLERQSALSNETTLGNRISQLENALTNLQLQPQVGEYSSHRNERNIITLNPLLSMEQQTERVALLNDRTRLLDENAALRAQVEELTAQNVQDANARVGAQIPESLLSSNISDQLRQQSKDLSKTFDSVKMLRDICLVSAAEIDELLSFVHHVSEAFSRSVERPTSISPQETCKIVKSTLDVLGKYSKNLTPGKLLLAATHNALRGVKSPTGPLIDPLTFPNEAESILQSDSDGGRERMLAEAGRMFKELKKSKDQMASILPDDVISRIPLTAHPRGLGLTKYLEATTSVTLPAKEKSFDRLGESPRRPKSAFVRSCVKDISKEAPEWTNRYEAARHSFTNNPVSSSLYHSQEVPLIYQSNVRSANNLRSYQNKPKSQNDYQLNLTLNCPSTPKHSYSEYPGIAAERHDAVTRLISASSVKSSAGQLSGDGGKKRPQSAYYPSSSRR